MLVASGSWCLPINLLISFPRSNSLPLILHLSKSSFQTPQRALSDRITSPSHLNLSSVYALLLPQNAFIKVNKNLLIMRSKEKKVRLFWNSLPCSTMLIPFSLECLATLVAPATPLVAVCPHLWGPSFSLPLSPAHTLTDSSQVTVTHDSTLGPVPFCLWWSHSFSGFPLLSE